jgi:signal transduction histidine kinase
MLVPEAEAELSSKGVEYRLFKELLPTAKIDVPLSMLNTTLRTKEIILFHNAAENAGVFFNDPYIVKNKPRSTLCLPIIHQNILIGIFYLENNLITGAFNNDRLTALKHLAAQVAISLENSLLLIKEREAREVAEEAARLRDEFLDIASHELKTPVTSLLLGSQMLSRSFHNQQPAQIIESLGGIAKQARHLSSLINDMLTVGRIPLGQLYLDASNSEILKTVRDVVGQMSPIFEEVKCKVEVIGTEVVGKWDTPKIEQVLVNLLSNAAKFGAGKPIEITVKKVSERVQIKITDHGIGIQPDALPALFGRYSRVVSPRQFAGLGLGLYIVKALVNLHHGTVSVESTPNAGSTFTVELPTYQ